MPTPIVATATADANAFDPKHPEVLAGKLAQHAHTPMYLGEVAALMQQRNQWNGFRGHIDGGLAHSAESAAAQIDAANADSHAHKRDKTGIYQDVISHGAQNVYLERYVYDLHTVTLLAQIGDIGDHTFRSLAGIGLGLAEKDGLISGADVVRTLGRRQPGEGAVDPMIANAEQEVSQSTHGAEQSLHDARAELEELDAKLQHELREIGPALWDPNETDPGRLRAARERVTKYIDDFHNSRRYQLVLGKVTTAAKALGVELQLHGDDIAAHGGHPAGKPSPAPGTEHDARAALVDSYTELAQLEPHAAEAIVWAAKYVNNAAFAPARGRIIAISNVAQTTLAAKTVREIAEIMREGGERESRIRAAMEHVETVLRPIHIAEGLLAVPELRTSLNYVRAHLHGFAKKGEAERVGKHVVNATEHADSVLVKRIGGGLGNMIGSSDQVKAVNEASTPKAIADAQELSERINAFHELVADGTDGKAELIDKAFEQIKEVYERLSKSLAVLGMPITAFNIVEDLKDVHQPLVAVKLVGDIAAIVGSAISLFPPLAPIGEVIAAVGTLVSWVSSKMFQAHVDKERQGDERQRLANPKLGLLGSNGSKLADTFTQSGSGGDLNAAARLGLTTGQIRALAVMHPYLFEFANEMDGADRLLRYLTHHDDEVQQEAGGKLLSPYRDSLFEFLHHQHAENLMGTAIGLAYTNADLREPPRDLIQRMIRSVSGAMPHAFGSS